MWNSEQRISLLRQLHASNTHFIEYLLARTEDLTASSCEMQLLQQLRMLNAVALREVCASPFTLYSLPFSNAAYWHDAATLSTHRECAARAFEQRKLSAQHVTQLAVFLAWHVACTDAASARLFFGMSAGTLEFFRHADVATLSSVATAAAPNLQLRWSTNPVFWPDMLRCAGIDQVRLQATRLLGAQLLAAELHGQHTTYSLPKRVRRPRGSACCQRRELPQ